MRIFRAAEHLRIGWSSIRTAKLRSFWTMLGIIIGVASVIAILSIGEGVKQQVAGQIHRMGKDTITIRPFGAGGSDSSTLISGVTTGSLTDKDVNAVRRTDGVTASAPLALVNGNVSGVKGRYTDGYVIGTSGDLSGLLNQSLAYGSFLDDTDDGSNVAVLGPHAADALFDENVPLGRSFTFHGQQFIVKGIFNQFSGVPLNKQADFNNVIFIPYDTAQQLTSGTASIYTILVRPASVQQGPAVAARLRHAIDRTHGGYSGVSILLGNQNIAANNSVLDLFTRAIAGVAAISLLVGGIGIMNVMLVSVAERTHEIGIRKAVGATNQQILGLFIAESTILSLLGGLIGIALAYLFSGVMRLVSDLHPVVTWQSVALATAVSLLLGIAFGSVPALKAARKDPIDALRAE